MNLFRRMLGTPEPAAVLSHRFRAGATLAVAPTKRDLMKLAEERKGHISPKAVAEEYDRLVSESYEHH